MPQMITKKRILEHVGNADWLKVINNGIAKVHAQIVERSVNISLILVDSSV